VEVKEKENSGVLDGVGFGLDFARLSFSCICIWIGFGYIKILGDNHRII
jgi:hypothetical protein